MTCSQILPHIYSLKIEIASRCWKRTLLRESEHLKASSTSCKAWCYNFFSLLQPSGHERWLRILIAIKRARFLFCMSMRGFDCVASALKRSMIASRTDSGLAKSIQSLAAFSMSLRKSTSVFSTFVSAYSIFASSFSTIASVSDFSLGSSLASAINLRSSNTFSNG